MNHLTRMALPVPALGFALGEDGDAYIASLAVGILIDGKSAMTVSGPTFETIMMCLRLRHLAFSPRTRSLIPGSMKAPSFASYVDRYWSALDSSAEETALTETADSLATLARDAETISWSQAN